MGKGTEALCPPPLSPVSLCLSKKLKIIVLTLILTDCVMVGKSQHPSEPEFPPL